jgi:hypothetical protein
MKTLCKITLAVVFALANDPTIEAVPQEPVS